jgi:hypothetical protein
MRWKTAFALTCLLAVSAAPAFAQELPSVDEVVNRFLDAEGGRERVAAIETRVAHGRLSIPAFGLDGDFESIVAPPNMVTTVNLTALNVVSRSGVTDDVAWQIDPTAGTSILSGAEALSQRLQAQIDPLLSWRDYFEGAEVVGDPTVRGSATYEVVFHAEGGVDFEIYFDQGSGLIARQVLVDGARRVSTDLDDYRAEDGIQLAHTIRASAPEAEVVLTVESFEHNVAIPAQQMALPSEIRALQGSN